MNNKYGVEAKSLDFGQAIGTCFKKYFIFDGRASKSEYWYFFLFYIFSYVVLYVIALGTLSLMLINLLTIYSVVVFIPLVSAGSRRLHDVGKSGFWQLVPIYGLILLAGDPGSGRSKPSSYNKINTSYDDGYSRSKYKSSSKIDLTDELEELQELYEDGTLSEAQFKRAKKKLLK